jgi:hypothetical protein
LGETEREAHHGNFFWRYGRITDRQTGGLGPNRGVGDNDPSNKVFGDAVLAITDNARGGDDILAGRTAHFSDDLTNLLSGDSDTLSGKAQGGNDSLTGGDQDQFSGGSVNNTSYGDALNMFGFARGGDDSITGGNSSSNFNGFVQNFLFGDGDSLSGKAWGGNDTVTGGSSSGSGLSIPKGALHSLGKPRLFLAAPRSTPGLMWLRLSALPAR